MYVEQQAMVVGEKSSWVRDALCIYSGGARGSGSGINHVQAVFRVYGLSFGVSHKASKIAVSLGIHRA